MGITLTKQQQELVDSTQTMGVQYPMLDKLYNCDIFSVAVSERQAHFSNVGLDESFFDLTKQELFQLAEELKQLANTLKD